MPNNNKISEQLRHFNGRFIKKKQRDDYEKRSATGKNNKGKIAVAKTLLKTFEKNVEERFPVQGTRVLDLEHVAQNMYCKKCKSPLLLQNIRSDKIQGLASTFDILCTKCLVITEVDSGKKYLPPEKKKRVFVINSRVALGNYILT